jgi:hypothetical protein
MRTMSTSTCPQENLGERLAEDRLDDVGDRLLECGGLQDGSHNS